MINQTKLVVFVQFWDGYNKRSYERLDLGTGKVKSDSRGAVEVSLGRLGRLFTVSVGKGESYAQNKNDLMLVETISSREKGDIFRRVVEPGIMVGEDNVVKKEAFERVISDIEGCIKETVKERNIKMKE